MIKLFFLSNFLMIYINIFMLRFLSLITVQLNVIQDTKVIKFTSPDVSISSHQDTISGGHTKILDGHVKYPVSLRCQSYA